MALAVPLRILGVDLDNPQHVEALALENFEISLTVSDEVVTATLLLLDGQHRVSAVRDLICQIRDRVPESAVPYVQDELVGIRDIAERCDVAMESARLWSLGRRRHDPDRSFPPPRQVLETDQKVVRLFAWRDVVAWVREMCDIDPEPGLSFLSDAEVASINDLLAETETAATRPAPSKISSAAAVQYELMRWYHVGEAVEILDLYGDAAHRQGQGVWRVHRGQSGVFTPQGKSADWECEWGATPRDTVTGADLDRELRDLLAP